MENDPVVAGGVMRDKNVTFENLTENWVLGVRRRDTPNTQFSDFSRPIKRNLEIREIF